MGIFSKINIGADYANRLEIIDMFEKSSETKKICEVGPGGKPLIIEYPGNGEFYGIEYPGCAEETIKAFQLNGKTIVMKECDLSNDKWSFGDDEFDVVVSNQVLEHMTNTDHFFEEFYRIMKPGGYGIISCPNLSSLHNIIQLILTFQPIMHNASDKFYGIGNPLSSHRHEPRSAPFHCHLRILSLRAMVELCALYGFKVETKRGGSFMGIPLIGRYIGRILPWYSVYCTVKVRKI
ncbi:MAG: class I SAM-dependent methyltransferase [bacterium]|nr:class I SAM-dependent methyltransferase [bacterium]